jgi:hypothetical protein
MQVNAKLEEKDKALQNVSRANIIVARRTVAVSATVLSRLSRAINNLALAIILYSRTCLSIRH